jgi:hypothetical protein
MSKSDASPVTHQPFASRVLTPNKLVSAIAEELALM